MVNENKLIDYGERMQLVIYPEYYDDESRDIVHNHFDCPVCGAGYVDSGYFRDLNDVFQDYGYVDISCEKCEAQFIMIKEMLDKQKAEGTATGPYDAEYLRIN